MEHELSAHTMYVITIEPDGENHRVLLNDELVSIHPTLHRAQFAAFLVAHELDIHAKKLEFEPDELGNLVAVVHGERNSNTRFAAAAV